MGNEHVEWLVAEALRRGGEVRKTKPLQDQTESAAQSGQKKPKKIGSEIKTPSTLERKLMIQFDLSEVLAVRDYARELQFLPDRQFRLDFAWEAEMVALEADGGIWEGSNRGRHMRAGGYNNDCEKCNLAAIQGWRVLRVTTKQVNSGQALEWVESIISTTPRK